jgi:hypothetical protein
LGPAFLSGGWDARDPQKMEAERVIAGRLLEWIRENKKGIPKDALLSGPEAWIGISPTA